MQLDSGQYFLFLAIVWVLWRLLPKMAAAGALLTASVLFYASSNLMHLGLLLLLAGFNYAAVRNLTVWNVRRDRTLMFWLAVVVDVGLLVFYKCACSYLDPKGVPKSIRDLTPVTLENTMAFPLGLSFLTFQMISCVTDIYRRKYQWSSGPGSFFLFAFFFPQISAGPIPRASELVPQLTGPRRLAFEDLEAGISLLAYGLFKKLVVANRLQIYVDHVFSSDAHTSTTPVLLAFVFNALRLYADFSGYTDMARGSARLFGIVLAENFNYPLLAESVTEFWRRWHITLSNWLRDYLYRPLVYRLRHLGDRTAVVLSVTFTMLVCGLWHRCSWPFLVFGLAHGSALSLEFLTRQSRLGWVQKWPWLGTRWIGRCYVFAFFVLTGAFFRADSLSQAWELYGKIFRPSLRHGLNELSAVSGQFLFLLNFAALALWGLMAALRPKWVEHRCAWFVLLCAMITLVLGKLQEGEFVYVAF
jgi:alginate O-acetyltransferase complex protein AlgI